MVALKLQELSRSTATVLDRAGFSTAEMKGFPEKSFDIIARRDALLLVIKLLTTRDEARREWASEMRVLSKVLDASPLMVVASSGPSSSLRDGVLYVKYGVPVISFNTLFDHLIDGIPPMVYHSAGGHYVKMDHEAIRRRREELRMSLGNLADSIGVTRKAVQMYEDGMGADIEVALRVESLLGIELIKPLDPFSKGEGIQAIRDEQDELSEVQKRMIDRLGSIGIEMIPTSRCPFEALARGKEDVLLASLPVSRSEVASRGQMMSEISRVVERDSFIMIDGSINRPNVGGTPVIRYSEITGPVDMDTVLALIRERGRGRR